ncbi:uncharacterized protein LOC143008235 isoform X2 [Genypterus blacodes]|uniref:uncharacterized protein LOC143008235 isoform X2 n=1 Tax=Genypterus blacodes TaxID=154954 RepID=UPI003F75CCB7
MPVSLLLLVCFSSPADLPNLVMFCSSSCSQTHTLSLSSVMARCRSYMRGLCISFTVLLMVFGVLMMGVGFSSYGNKQPAEVDHWSGRHGFLVLQVFGPLTLVLSLLGVCAAIADIRALLLLFSAQMLVEFVALMVVASPLLQVQAQVDGGLEEVFLNVAPLHRSDHQFQTELNKLQNSDFCCGLRSYEDWEDQLPVSCYCSSLSDDDMQSNVQPGNFSSDGSCVLLGHDFDPLTSEVTEKLWIKVKPCGPILKSHLVFLIKMAALSLSLVLGLDSYCAAPPVEMTVDDFDRVKYQPQPSLT